MSVDAPPTPVSPPMAPVENKEKKRKRDKDLEKSAKKQKREAAAATDTPVDDGREERRAEKRRKKSERKGEKSKSHDHAQVNGAQVQTVDEPGEPKAQPDIDARSETAQARSDANEAELQKHSPFFQRTSSFYLPLSPCAANFPLEGLLAEHISPLLLTYYPPLNGVLLSYSNARLFEHPHSDAEENEGQVLSQCINEYAVTFTWLTADFVLFRPRRGTWMAGYVRLGNENMIGLVCYNYFNAVIERERMPTEWTWVSEDEEVEEQKGRRRGTVESVGFFRDGHGKRVEGKVVFRVEDFDALQGEGGGSVSIMGTLLPGTGG